jgi:hypothetical protein
MIGDVPSTFYSALAFFKGELEEISHKFLTESDFRKAYQCLANGAFTHEQDKSAFLVYRQLSPKPNG